MRFALAAGSRFAFGLALCLGLMLSGQVSRAPAQPPAKGGDLPPLNPAAVEESIDRGVEYLKATQNNDGSWGEGGHVVGISALSAIAMIESGVRLSDASIIRAANYLRGKAGTLSDTYQISLTIIFLDRLKDPKRDDPTIQALGARLIGGQTATGGWHYAVSGGARGNRISDPEVPQMFAALKKMTPPPATVTVSYRERPSRLGLCIKQSEDVVVKPAGASGEAVDYEKKRASIVKDLPQNLKNRVVFQNPSKWEELDNIEKKELYKDHAGDNSNTHFAMIGLWIARKHGVPTERTFAMVARRFRTSQDPSGGGWAYGYPQGGSNNPMTCIGLLGLAIGNALAVDPDAGRPEKDQAIVKALTFLGKNVGMPVGHFKDRPKLKDVGGLYYLWALERIAVLYDITTLDKKDWYRWGAEILISNQQQDGSWKDGGFPEGEKANVCTPLAILFLQRANLTPDLSKRLIIDSSALTAKVNEPTPPPPPPPPPMPKVDTNPPPFVIPKFEIPKTEEPKAPAPTPAAPVTPTASSSEPAKKESAPLWPWLAGGIGLIAIVCLGLFFATRKKKDGDDDDEDDEDEKKPKKKAKKSADKASKPKKPKS